MIRKSRGWALMTVLLLFVSGNINAQYFRVGASVADVPATGFYAIPVNAELSAYAKPDLSDVRIAGPDGKYSPYIIRRSQPEVKDNELTSELKLLSELDDSASTTVKLGADEAAWNCGISLTMNNTSVRRYAQISGSNDGRKWFIVDDHILFDHPEEGAGGSYTRYIPLPHNNYRYFKLKIDNAHTDPIHIVAGVIMLGSDRTITMADSMANPAPVITQKNTEHLSFVTIRSALPYVVNKVTLSVKGAMYYERSVKVYISATDSVHADYPVRGFLLSSRAPASFSIPGQKVKTILLEIENNDDEPLTVTQASTAQDRQYLVSWLEKGKQYNVVAANENAMMPQYDLTKFRDSVPAALPFLSYGSFSIIAKNVVNAQPAPAHSYWLWIVIVVSVIVLSLLTYRLMKEVKNG